MSVFAKIKPEYYLYESQYFFIIKDKYPVSDFHLLIISKSNALDFFLLSDVEKLELPLLIEKCKALILESKNPNGFNIGMNCGEVAGQSIMHFHCHVIPRYSGDMENPLGGVRHCIPGKGYY